MRVQVGGGLELIFLNEVFRFRIETLVRWVGVALLWKRDAIPFWARCRGGWVGSGHR